jgi:hypothetical protein
MRDESNCTYDLCRNKGGFGSPDLQGQTGRTIAEHFLAERPGTADDTASG